LVFEIWNFSPKNKHFPFNRPGCLRPEAVLNLKPISYSGSYGGQRSFYFTCGGIILYAESEAYEDRNGGVLPATADRLLSMTYVYILLVLIYIFVPYDLLPDFLGGWGRVDDLVVLGFLMRYLFAQRKRSRGTQTSGTKPGPDAEKTYTRGGQGKDSSRFDSKDPYTVLGVDRTASAETIKKAYRQLVNKFHPDKVDHLGEEFKALAEKRFKQIQQAYQSILQTRR
jgi:hypothetical protein